MPNSDCKSNIRRVYIVVKPQLDEVIPVLNIIMKVLDDLNIRYSIEEEILDKIKVGVCYEKFDIKKSDIVISIGGNGTFLHTVHKVVEHSKPILGISTKGSFGFLNEIGVENVEEFLRRVIEGNYVIDEVNLLEEIHDDKTFYALNEIMVLSKEPHKTIKLEVLVDQNTLFRGKMDGVIIASPIGSTAYSYSAGGPIVDPSLSALVITPVCPVRLFVRPIVVPDSRVIKIKVLEGCGISSGDGILFDYIDKNCEILVRKSSKTIKIVRAPWITYYSKLARLMNFIQEF